MQGSWGVWLAFSGLQIPVHNKMVTCYSATPKKDSFLLKLASSELNSITGCCVYEGFCSDGRTVAIKKVHKLTFSVTMTVRKEVRQVR